MKVLSLFDGMSCGQIALDQLGIPVEKYYASEIDKYAIKVTQANYPNTVQVGDICDLDAKDYKDVDLIQAGSPCQGFSFAGKQLAFDDPRSALFFEFIRLLKAIKPKYFLLENVRMKKEFLEIITEQVSQCYAPEDVDNQFLNVLGEVRFEPIFINSSLVSAQSRQRYYWTNIPGIKQPEDRGIVLRDILEDNFDSERDKAHCIDANYYKGANVEQYKKKHRRQLVNKPIKLAGEKGNHYGGGLFDTKGKSPTLNGIGNGGGGTNNIPKVPAKNKEQMIETKPKRVGTTIGIKGHDILKRVYGQDGKSPTITAHAARGSAPKIETKPKKAYDIPREILKDNERQRRVYDPSGKSPTVLARSDSPKITTPKQVGKIKDGGQGNRIYSQDGKSSTLSAQSGGTAGNGNTLVETKPKQVGIAVDIKGHDQIKRVYSPDGKSPTVTTCGGGHREPKVVTGGAFRARSKDEDGKHVDWKETKPKQMLELRKDQKSNAISTVGKDSLVVNSYREVRTEEAKRLRKEMRQKTGKDHTPFRAKKLEPRKDGKVGTVTPSLNKDHEISIEKEELTWRKLSCRECERLQTVPDDYTNHVSNTRRYAMLGNGWTVEVIKHIYKNME